MIKHNFLSFYHLMPDFIKYLMRYILFLAQYASDKKLRICLRENKKLRNIHAEKRCFILGNGSSLTSQNLSLLKDEYVFTVNSLPEAGFYEKLEATYHVMIDPNYFNAEKQDIIQLFQNIMGRITLLKKKPKLILLYKGIKFKEYFKTLNLNGIVFIYSGLAFHKPKSFKMNMSKLMTGAQNVVQKAIFCAMYMGFKEIILLGCDFPLTLKCYHKGNYILENWLHAYEENKTVFTEYPYTNIQSCEMYLKSLNNYKQISIYCAKKGIKIYNATDGGFLDVFERKDFEDFFKKDNGA